MRPDGRPLQARTRREVGVAAVVFVAIVVLGALGNGCRRTAAPPVRASEKLPGGATSVSFEPRPLLFLPAANLGPRERPDFHAGKALAKQPWVKAPSSTDARDGLGPLYNARTCLACHEKGGRAQVQSEDGPLPRGTLVRLSLPGFDPRLGVVPEPTYGSQLQVQSIALGHQLRAVPGVAEALPPKIPPEGRASIEWLEQRYTYPDGREVALRRPRISLENLAYGELAPETRVGLRHAPPLHGLGLLELVHQDDIDRLADPEDRNGDGISGRVNQVWDPVTQTTLPGRFGLKANQPNLRVQVAAAFHGDIGITSSVFPELPCTPAQVECAKATHGAEAGAPEIPDDLLSLVVNFSRSIGVPRRRKPDHPLVRRGRDRFYESGCASCHAPRFVTGSDARFPHLSAQEIWPYTDLLLHDMGEGLADRRTDYLATGAEWRTAPLWGVGLARAIHRDAGLLHDGRARTVEEAILWHDGEARSSRERFTSLPLEERKALLAFVRSL